MLRFLLLFGVFGLAIHLWKGYDESKPIASPDSLGGFASVLMPSGAKPNTVLILAPKNCSSAAAQRADAMATQLTELGIPNQRSSRVTLSVTNFSEQEMVAMKTTEAVLRGEIPAVFVSGMGKANPGIDEVIAEYRRTH